MPRAFALDPTLAAADPRIFDDFERQLRERGFAADDDPRVAALVSAAAQGPMGNAVKVYSANGDGSWRIEQRQFAVNTFPTYPGGGPQVTVDTALQQPNIIARALTDITYLRFVADRIFARGTAEQVRSGAAVFQRAESLFPDRGAEVVGVRSEWPRSGWTVPDLFAAAVQKMGLETPIADETRRRNAMDELARAMRKLGNAVVKFVDQTAMAALLADPAVNVVAAVATWNNAGAKIITDVTAARNTIVNADLGYDMDTLIINPAQELSMLTDTNILAALPRESTPRNAVLTGRPVPILGLQQILVTNQLAAGTAIALNAGVAGTIAEEQPDPREGYTGFDAGGGQPTILLKTYREEDQDETILRAARFPAIWISEPRAVAKITGV